VKIHPVEAAARRIVTDCLCGSTTGGASVFCTPRSLRRPPGVLVAESIWWPKQHPGGKGINQLTSDRLTDLGECSTLHENLVEVELAGARQP